MSLVQFQNIIARHDSQEIANRLKAMYDSLKPKQYTKFVIANRELLQLVWNYIAKSKDSIIIEKVPRKLKSCIDLYLKPLISNKHDILSFCESHCTKQFLMFIQGITLFDSDGPEMGKPAYHRNASCGPRHTTEKYKNQNLSCIGVKEAKEFQRVRRNVWNCFMERLIYDRIYNHVLYGQNFNHKLQVHTVERKIFETCFHMSEFYLLDLRVDMNDHFTPTRLICRYETINKNGEKANIIDIYKKKLLTGPVDCERKVYYQGERRPHVYHKTSTFFSNSEWVPSKHN